jgi:hypothetical protein
MCHQPGLALEMQVGEHLSILYTFSFGKMNLISEMQFGSQETRAGSNFMYGCKKDWIFVSKGRQNTNICGLCEKDKLSAKFLAC